MGSTLWNTKIHYRLKVTLWRFPREVIPTRERIQTFANLVDVCCLLCVVGLENDLQIMAHNEVSQIVWFCLLGFHLQNISFSNLLTF